jgi:hypothetical protein
MRFVVPSIPRHIWMPHWAARMLRIAFLAMMLLAGVCSAITFYTFARLTLGIG